ncbi:DMT family transporter [Ferroacidibacillus organovorans]|uniref:EamA family transporter n=1 Tax=Ferroacidibacillus organovorans TaxID=1765683 RepID=A0A162UDL1_9BACL|nr:DMT family transporter [Ferroacidibacillus organovorans]KYP81668.1 hypothetical protein AYJ22_06490 [Ferroacidibacillus organovorans]OAG94137.1 hypothetical protein AYW79_06855 [Ferroacidibacillus organovorans]OPG15347.1 EamA family transporter [Ferroacidibacillus organovorans]
MSHTTPRFAYALLFLAIFSVSFAAILIKLTNAPAEVTAFYRMSITAVLLAPFAARGLRAQISLLTRRDWGLLAISGACLAIHFVFWIGSLFYTSVASSTLFLSLQPIFAMIGSFVFFREKTRGAAWLYASIAVLGTALIGWQDLHLGGRAAYGDLLSVLGTLSVVGYMLAGQRLRQKLSFLHYSFLVYCICSALLFIYSVGRGDQLTGYAGSDVRAFLLLAIIPTIFGHTMFNFLLRFFKAPTIAMTIVGEPLIATALAYLFFGTRVHTIWFLGATLAVFGIIQFMRNTLQSKTSVRAPSGVDLEM